MTHPIITLENISKSFLLKEDKFHSSHTAKELWALRDISLEIRTGEILGVIGRNGAGKTTFLNILAGVLTPTEGRIEVKGKILGLFNLGVGFQEELTGHENIFLNGAILGATHGLLGDKFTDIVTFSELGNFIDQPLGTYSQGMKLRLAFSIMVHLPFDILVIDEVLAVGDTQFQNKCFEQLMAFKRQGLSLVITSQDAGMVERLATHTLVLDHGKKIFLGSPSEGTRHYRKIIAQEKFSIGPGEQGELITSTKQWSDDIETWGQKLGAKEVTIDSVRFLNRWGMSCQNFHPHATLRIHVRFTVHQPIEGMHFGIAIFQKDGLYCYGPNTAFDHYRITHPRTGQGSFNITLSDICLCPQEYVVSVAIWDKQEKLAYDYHAGCYPFTVSGQHHPSLGFLNLPFEAKPPSAIRSVRRLNSPQFKQFPDVSEIHLRAEDSVSIIPDHTLRITILNADHQQQSHFKTNEPVRFHIHLNKPLPRHNRVWMGLFRSDKVLCQGIFFDRSKSSMYEISFPQCRFLPGRYFVIAGIWDYAQRQFYLKSDGTDFFQVVSHFRDHGTVWMPHQWTWKIRTTKLL